MATKIRELKTIIDAQNQMITTVKRENTDMKDGIGNLYKGLVSLKSNYVGGRTELEEKDYPDLRAEDILKVTAAELIRRVPEVIGVLYSALSVNRQEVIDMYKELDSDVAASVAQWNQIRSDVTAEKKAVTFRQDIVSSALAPRPETPDSLNSLENHASVSVNGLATPPDSTNKNNKQQKKNNPTKKSTTTLAEALKSPVLATSPSVGTEPARK